MFSYYGSKSKVIEHYPAPSYKKIIEPFAGSARYSLKYHDKDVLIMEKFDKVYKIWKYLQNASKEQILRLPNDITDLRAMDLLDEEKYLIGYCIGRGSARPRNKCGKFNNWIQDKIRIADSVEKIKHWDIRFGDYREIENEEATWFVDAPYKMQIHGYNHKIDNYDELADWCKSRKGQVIVCENSHGDWLPFRPLRQMQGINKQTLEVIWTKDFNDLM